MERDHVDWGLEAAGWSAGWAGLGWTEVLAETAAQTLKMAAAAAAAEAEAALEAQALAQ
jgi:hypothetical protein